MSLSLASVASVAFALSAFALAGCSSSTPADKSGSSEQHVEQTGPAEEGDVCDSTKGKVACEEGFECRALPEGSRFTGTICQAAPHEEGDFCMDDVPCAAGLKCTPPAKGSSNTGNTCEQALHAEGDFCMDDVPCAAGLKCTPPKGGMSTGNTCEK